MPTPLSPKKPPCKTNASQDETAALEPVPTKNPVKKSTPRVRKPSSPSENNPILAEDSNIPSQPENPPQNPTLPSEPLPFKTSTTLSLGKTRQLTEQLSRRAAWLGIGILGLTVVASALFSDLTVGTQLAPETRLQMMELARSATAATQLSSPAEAMGVEQQVYESYRNISEGGGADAQRAEVLQGLAELALQRADVPRALAAARAARAYAEVAHQLRLSAQAVLCQTEGYLLAGHADDLAVPASREAAKLLASLPADNPAPDLKFRLALINARLHSHQAVAAQQEDRMHRQIALARLKRKSLTLSEQLRGEMIGEYQRREKLQADAAATNDPEKMAQASNEKDAYDAKFSAQLKDREDLLRKETAEVMMPLPAIAERLDNATTEWRQVLESATAAGIVEKNLARLGLGETLLALGNTAEAETLLQANVQEPAANPFLQAETHLLLSQCSAQKLPGLVGDAAKPFAESGLALSSKTQEILGTLPMSSRNRSLTSRAQRLAADFQTNLGHADIAQTVRATATQSDEDAAKDHGWQEILWQSRLSLNEARRQFLTNGSPPARDLFQLAEAADLALRFWHGRYLSDAPHTAKAEAMATTQLVVSTDIDRFPWHPLLDSSDLFP